MENTNADLASFEGKYPKDRGGKRADARPRRKGTDDMKVVFSDSDDSRFDMTESKIEVAGGSVIVDESLAQFAVDKDAPLAKSRGLRPSVEEMRQTAAEQFVVDKPQLDAPPELPEDIDESRTLNERTSANKRTKTIRR